MFESVFDLPLAIAGPVIILSLCAYPVIGLLVVRGRLLPRLRTRPQLQKELRDYAQYVINTDWPAQQRGEVALGGVEMLDRFQSTLTTFEPATRGQELLHGEALRAYNEMLEACSLRLDAVAKTGLPNVLWLVVLAGAVIGLTPEPYQLVYDKVMQDTP